MNSNKRQRPVVVALLATTMIAGLSAVPASAQTAPAAAPPAAVAAPASQGTIRTVTVTGTQRLEPDTVLSYTKLRIGGAYSQEILDQALRDLYETELFADVQIRNYTSALTLDVK